MSITLPIVSVQPSYSKVIDDVHEGVVPSEEFWVSCYKQGSDSIHARINAVLDERNRDQVNLISNNPKVDISRSGDGKYVVDASTFGIFSAKLFLPDQQFADPERSQPQQPHRITAFDVSADGSQFASGFLDGSVHLYPATNPLSFHKYKQIARAHQSTVTAVRFFPSSRVLLTSGADFSLNILPADPQQTVLSHPKIIQPVRTLRGHTRGVTSTAIVSRGRNVLSSSSDGTLRLWDVSTGTQIFMLPAGRGQFSSVTQATLGERGESELGGGALTRPDGEEERSGVGKVVDPREVDTADKLVFCSLQSGHFEAFDLRSRKSVFYSSPSGPSLTTIAYAPELSLLATGSSNGTVSVYDTRSLSSPVTSFSRNTSAIEDLVFISPPSDTSDEAAMLVATYDALPYLATVRPEGPGVIAEIIGGDCDAVRVMRTRGRKEFWTASDDGIVRKYTSW